MCRKTEVLSGGKVGDIFKLKMEVTGFMETDCIIALIAGIMVLVSGSVIACIGFAHVDEAYGVPHVITGIGVIAMGVINLWRKTHRLACGMKAPFPTFFLH